MAQNENISLSLTNKIDILNRSQSLDARYGVYDEESDALSAMLAYGADGRQVAVYTDKSKGKVRLYLYNEVLHQLEPISDVVVEWGDIGGDQSDINISGFTNDSGFVTSSGVTSVSGTANQIVSTGGNTPVISLHSNTIALLELAGSAVQPGDLATAATTGDYNDLNNLPTPQSFDDVLGVGNETDKEAIFQSEVSINYSKVSNERVISGETGKGSYTKINYDGIEHTSGGEIHSIVFTPDVGGSFTHSFPAKSGAIAHLSDIVNHIPKTYSIVITLSKSQINNLNNTPITITSAELGLTGGQVVKFLREQTEVRIDIDGTKFNSTRPIHIGNGDTIDIMDLSHTIYAAASPNGIYAGSGNASSLTYKARGEYYITTEEEITGGGTNSFIEFTFFYQKINL